MQIHALLKHIPLFDSLSDEQQSIIQERTQIAEYKRGETIYKEGEPASGFFCLVSGRVVISTHNSYGKDSVLEHLHRGEYFGMISLLTGKPHSVTASALNDCLLLKIEKNDFNYILKKIPSLATNLSLILSRRLKREDLHQKIIFESTILAVFSSSGKMGKTIYSLNLGLSLKKETAKSVILLDIGLKDKAHIIPAKLGITYQPAEVDLSESIPQMANIKDYILKEKGMDLLCISYRPEDESGLNRLSGILNILANDYHCIILDLPSELDKVIFKVLNQSDLIHIITGPDVVELKRTRRLIDRLRDEFEFKKEKIKIIINDYRLSDLSHPERIEILKHDVFATLPHIEYKQPQQVVLDVPECEYARVLRRVSRKLGECTLGLALGIGAAYGLCHIGVLKVIEEEKIPVDMISASTLGAFIAGLWASGRSADEIKEIAEEFKNIRLISQLINLTSKLAGFRMCRFFKKYLGNKTFYDLKLPLKILARNSKTKQPMVVDKGSLIEAILASCALPGAFLPLQDKSQLLFEFGFLNPLPVTPLIKSEIKKIIGINLSPSWQELIKASENIKNKTLKVKQNIKKRPRLFGLRWHAKDIYNINIFDLIFADIEIQPSEIADKGCTCLADIVLNPDTSGINWFEFNKQSELIERGRQAGVENLDKIRQLVKQ